MSHSTLLTLLAAVTEAGGEKEAFVEALDALRQVVRGHYYSVLYGRVGCASVDLFHPGEGWLGIDAEIAKRIARHHASHPFCVDFFFSTRPVVYLRSGMVGEAKWRRSDIYRFLDSTLGIEDMIGMYFPMPSGQFGALFCGADAVFGGPDFEEAKTFHRVLVPLLANVPEYPAGTFGGALDINGLTSREADVMEWLDQGKSNQDIGVILGISQHTVRKHLENIFRKLGVENRTAAVREARKADRRHRPF